MKKTLFLLAVLVALINSQCTILGCETCASETTCADCNEALGYDYLINSAQNCDCAYGFYSIITGDQCFACDYKYPNCKDCSSTACSICKAGTTNIGGGVCRLPCESIFLGCSTCDANVCSACDSNRNLTINGTGTGCDCMVGFVRQTGSDAFCVPCHHLLVGCQTCSSASTCSSCKSPFSISGGTCNCPTGYYLVPKVNYFLDATCISCGTITGCTGCSGPGACTQCGSAFYLSSGSCIPCSGTHPNCQTCSPPAGACTGCSDPYVVDTGSCSLCDKFIMGCIGCTSVTSCTSCDTGNNFKELTVSPSPECECIDESYRNSTGCHLCRLSLSNCNQCTSATTCTNCVGAFFVNSGSCSPCGVGCLVCTSASACTTCDAAGHFIKTGQVCNCNTTYYLFGTSCVLCSDALIGCQYCEDENECDTCYASGNFLLDSDTDRCYCNATRYYNSTSHVCELCSDVLSNCEECSNSTYCDLCATGYTEVHTFGPSESSCAQCSTLMTGCLVCATPTVCTECDSANNFIFNGSSCQCAPAYFLNLTECALCNASTPQCTACTSSGCTACAASYFLNATSKLCQLCTSFSPQCTACTSSGCSTCEDDYVVSNTSCARLCNISLCIDCFNSTTCQFCVIHATLSGDHTKCNCDTGYFSNSTNCALCSSVLTNCVECESALKCTACQDGFVVDLETDQCVAFESALKMASLLLVLVFAALSF